MFGNVSFVTVNTDSIVTILYKRYRQWRLQMAVYRDNVHGRTLVAPALSERAGDSLDKKVFSPNVSRMK
jgi:hypothetical protein